MREVNFSIPNVNKASVGITTALYDRRALDCTSTLPLINSLNHLAYLTTSSARIRDILTVDGGVERLVCILKEGRNKDVRSMWKWSLAFQCVVNIGVRGSENVRTRVVEADMVPVIATILDNYIQVLDKFRAKAEENVRKNGGHGRRGEKENPTHQPRPKHSLDRSSRGSFSEERHFRRQNPPPSIEIPPPQLRPHSHHQQDVSFSQQTQAAPPFPPPRFQGRGRPHDSRPLHAFPNGNFPRDMNRLQPLAPLPQDVSVTGFGLPAVREADRLPSMQVGGPSQPASPTTPNPPPVVGVAHYNLLPRRPIRPSIRHQRSMSGESEGVNDDDLGAAPELPIDSGEEPMVDIQTDPEMEQDPLLDGDDADLGVDPTAGGVQGADTLNLSHRSPLDGSIVNVAGNNPPMGTTPPTAAPALAMPALTRYLMDNSVPPIIPPSMPREEDVLMSLQLLAYVSKYCNLRSYFQCSHLVPKLSISKEIHLLDAEPGQCAMEDDDDEEEQDEYTLPDDFNIFPLVEKFTVRHHPPDMQYWAGVVMRNLCRKDDVRGGIRQCAYYECGKWEEYTRQFAKCRRCRRTKYCSKDCQKSAWVFHRHWCVAAAP